MGNILSYMMMDLFTEAIFLMVKDMAMAFYRKKMEPFLMVNGFETGKLKELRHIITVLSILVNLVSLGKRKVKESR